MSHLIWSRCQPDSTLTLHITSWRLCFSRWSMSVESLKVDSHSDCDVYPIVLWVKTNITVSQRNDWTVYIKILNECVNLRIKYLPKTDTYLQQNPILKLLISFTYLPHCLSSFLSSLAHFTVQPHLCQITSRKIQSNSFGMIDLHAHIHVHAHSDFHSTMKRDSLRGTVCSYHYRSLCNFPSNIQSIICSLFQTFFSYFPLILTKLSAQKFSRPTIF